MEQGWLGGEFGLFNSDLWSNTRIKDHAGSCDLVEYEEI